VAVAGDQQVQLLARQLDRNLACVPTSSMGRFFDALASLIGIRHAISYEAQAAIEFEIAAASWTGPLPEYRFELSDPTSLLSAVCDSVRAGVPVGAIAMACHVAIADGVAIEVARRCAERSIDIVVLTGGVFQNVLLTDLLAERLEVDGLDVRTHRLVPPNDGGLALGQLAIAHHSAAHHSAAHHTDDKRTDGKRRASPRFASADQTGA
jgi:hydrogenase maturation protein HypF